MPQMLFPDPRFRSPTALGAFGMSYACDEVRAAQDELDSLLDQAVSAKLLVRPFFSFISQGTATGHPIAVAAQNVMYELQKRNLVVFSDEACDEWTARLEEASNSLRVLLEHHGTGEVEYVPPEESPYVAPEKPDTLDKLKPLFIAGAVVAGVVLLIPIAFEVAGISRALRRKKRRGYGSRR
jgi:hypothetical protein